MIPLLSKSRDFEPSLSRLGADFMNYENFLLFNDLMDAHGLRPRQGPIAKFAIT
jgi:hypothetical protein